MYLCAKVVQSLLSDILMVTNLTKRCAIMADLPATDMLDFIWQVTSWTGIYWQPTAKLSEGVRD